MREKKVESSALLFTIETTPPILSSATAWSEIKRRFDETMKSPTTAERTGKLAVVAALLVKKKSPETMARLGKARTGWDEKATENPTALEALNNVMPPRSL
jgi:hypothetical protein